MIDIDHLQAPVRPTTRQRIGLGLAGVYCATSIPSAFVPSAPEGEVGPPLSILVLCSVLGVVGLVAAIAAWRTPRPWALRLLAASAVVITITALPAFFVDVPALVKTMVAVSVVWVLASLVLVFSDHRATTAP